MYTKEQVEAMEKKEAELAAELESLMKTRDLEVAKIKADYVDKINVVRIQLREIRKPLYNRKYYYSANGTATEAHDGKDYYRRKMRELAEYKKKMMEESK